MFGASAFSELAFCEQAESTVPLSDGGGMHDFIDVDEKQRRKEQLTGELAALALLVRAQ